MKTDFFEKEQSLFSRWCKLDFEKEIKPELFRIYIISCFVLEIQPVCSTDCLTHEQKIDLESVVNQDKCCIHQEYKDHFYHINQEPIESYFSRIHRFLSQIDVLFRKNETFPNQECLEKR